MSNIAQINYHFPFVFPAIFFMFGACIGSFLNVCIFRIPAGKSIVNPPSHCACGKPIAWYDNIPILAWFFLRGRARCCGGKISFRYPLVEFLTAAIFCGMWILLPPTIAGIGMVFAAILIFCTFVDIDTMMLPDVATFGGAVLGVAISAAFPDLHAARIEGAPFFASSVASVVSSICGVAVGSGVLYWLRLAGEAVFRREAMGEGDVVLVGMIGAFCGWQGALFAIFGGSLIGAIIMLPTMLLRSLFAAKKDEMNDKSNKIEKTKESVVANSSKEEEFAADAIPYGPWLAVGGLVYYMFCAAEMNAYFNGIGELLFR